MFINIKLICHGSAMLVATIVKLAQKSRPAQSKYARIFLEHDVEYSISLNNQSFGSSGSGKGGMEWIDLAQDRDKWWGL